MVQGGGGGKRCAYITSHEVVIKVDQGAQF